MDHLNISRNELLAEIHAIQQQAQEAQMTILKAEGALQFAHHLLSQIEKVEGEHQTIAEETLSTV